jgi:hypothetical protein
VRQRSPAGGQDATEAERVQVALDQLDRADLYLAAAAALDFADPWRRRLLQGLHADARLIRRLLTRPHLVE